MKKFISVLLILVFSSFVHAEYTTENKVIKVVIPQSPGSGVGMLYRHIEAHANKRNIKMMPVFKPGADGKIGIDYAATQENNGNTLLLSTVSDYVGVNNLGFETVAPITKIDLVLVASKKSKIKNVNDIVKLEQENPGKLTWAYMSSAQVTYIDNFAKVSNINANTIYKVPFRTNGGVQSLVNGEADLTVLPPSMIASLKDHLIVVDIDNETNQKLATKENASGLFLPKNSPKGSADFWNRFVNDLLNDDEFKFSMKKLNIRTFTNTTSDELTNAIDNWKQ
jgi:tripartite-type tricarboxylate transporter receptor subunit TctC